MMITGDPSQIDLPLGQKSGLVEALEILGDVENIVTVRFTDKDVVRHPMVAAIVRAYEKRGAARTISRQKHIVAEGENTPSET